MRGLGPKNAQKACFTNELQRSLQHHSSTIPSLLASFCVTLNVSKSHTSPAPDSHVTHNSPFCTESNFDPKMGPVAPIVGSVDPFSCEITDNCLRKVDLTPLYISKLINVLDSLHYKICLWTLHFWVPWQPWGWAYYPTKASGQLPRSLPFQRCIKCVDKGSV